MPSVYELKKTLSLKAGEVLGNGFVVKDIEQATMDEKKPRELYNFKVHLWLAPPTSSSHGQKRTNVLEDAKQALMQTAEERQIMYSSYGSPYEVHLEHVKATSFGPMLKEQEGKGGAEGQEGQKEEEGEKEEREGLIEVHALAVAKRRRDLPRLSGMEHGSSEDEEEAADDEMKRQGYRVVKAHFKSSHCPVCGNEFVPGEHIAKPQEDHSRGGWAHSTCLANRLETPMTPTKSMTEGGGN